MQCPRSASVEQLIVRNAAPEEERQARRQLQIADAIDRPGRARRGVPLDPEQELGLTSMPRSAISMPASNPFRPSLLDRT